jgi:hypothetical protein
VNTDFLKGKFNELRSMGMTNEKTLLFCILEELIKISDKIDKNTEAIVRLNEGKKEEEVKIVNKTTTTKK